MCWAAAAVGLNIASTIYQQAAAERAARAGGEAAKATAINAITNMNHAFAGYEMERSDAFDSAVNEIMDTRMKGMGLSSSVQAALDDDNMTGRTANLLARSVSGQEARAIASVQDNYQRKGEEIDINKENTLLGTKNYVASIKAPEMPSRLGALINIGSSIVAGHTNSANMQAQARAQGMSYDPQKGIVPFKGVSFDQFVSSDSELLHGFNPYVKHGNVAGISYNAGVRKKGGFYYGL